MTAIAMNSEIVGRYQIPTENLSTRLVRAMNTLSISQSQLAREINVKPQTIQYLCTSNAARSKFSSRIAEALGINTEWLLTGRGEMISEPLRLNSIKNIPVIEWQKATDISLSELNCLAEVECISTKYEFSSGTFALKMNDNSMSPRFEDGTILIIEPTNKAHDNEFVLVKTKFSNVPILRQYVEIDGDFLLKPLNTHLYKEIKLSNDDKIIGVLRQTINNFTRR